MMDAFAVVVEAVLTVEEEDVVDGIMLLIDDDVDASTVLVDEVDEASGVVPFCAEAKAAKPRKSKERIMNE